MSSNTKYGGYDSLEDFYNNIINFFIEECNYFSNSIKVLKNNKNKYSYYLHLFPIDIKHLTQIRYELNKLSSSNNIYINYNFNKNNYEEVIDTISQLNTDIIEILEYMKNNISEKILNKTEEIYSIRNHFELIADDISRLIRS